MIDFTIDYPEITKEIILRNTSEEAIMEHYLGIPVKKGMFRSPLRQDDKPTCSFTRDINGRLIFKDFSGAFYGDAFEVVKHKFNVSFKEALDIIAKDFNIKDTKIVRKLNYTPFKTKSGSSDIKVEIKEFSEEELNWWKQFNITEDILHRFKVFSCKSVFLNGEYLTRSSKNDYIFAYYKESKNNIDYFRVYFPMRSNFKFLSNWPSKMIQGSRQLPSGGDLLVITKSLKDVMTLYSFGITAIAPNSETLFLNKNQYDYLVSNFNKVVLFYDNDLPGITNMNRIRKIFNIDCIWIPRNLSKDISDYCKKFGPEKTKELIEMGKNYIYGRS